MEDFKFNPDNGFLDPSTYREPQNETEVRTQFMSLHNQTKDFINSILTRYGVEAVYLRINSNSRLEFSIDGITWNEVMARGEPGPGIIPGGNEGQVLKKKTDADFDTEWGDPYEYSLPVASSNTLGGIKADSNKGTIVIGENNKLKVNQLVIDELNIENAPVQTLSTPYWFDIESEFTKYIDVVVEGCVATAKIDHYLFDTAFDKKCGYIESRDGVLRFLLKTDIEDITISTIVKELIIQYQEEEEEE